MNKLYKALLITLLALLLAVGVWSLVDQDVTEVSTETGKLASMPEFSWRALLDGSYFSGLDAYYTDHFPARSTLMTLNRELNRFYAFSGSKNEENNVLILDLHTGAEFGGESLRPEELLPQKTEPEEPSDPQSSEQKRPPKTLEPLDPVEPEKQDEPKHPDLPESGVDVSGNTGERESSDPEDLPDADEARWLGNVVIFGTRAMEVPYADYDVIESYAQAVGMLDDALGENVRTISLLTPNGAEFYTSENMHSGLSSQKKMINYCYERMPDSVLTVNAYDSISEHQDEYVYFRTDHHWTQLGAYYAYRAFCETAGFEAVELDAFETGRYDRFVGSMYSFTSSYPQSQVLLDNPDYLDYYLPIAKTSAQYYASASLENGVPVSVVIEQISNGNKYLCFIGGDHPVTVIESDAEGPVCAVLKESYGNAFVPFLTSHYSKIYVIDPREFNQEGQPTLDLADFAQEQGINDLIVINYPYMINNLSYIRRLRSLAGT